MAKNNKSEEEVKAVEPKAETKKEAKKPTLKEMYADLFAKEKLRQTGKEFKGDPSVEAAQGHPLLVKYHQNWLNAAE